MIFSFDIHWHAIPLVPWVAEPPRFWPAPAVWSSEAHSGQVKSAAGGSGSRQKKNRPFELVFYCINQFLIIFIFIKWTEIMINTRKRVFFWSFPRKSCRRRLKKDGSGSIHKTTKKSSRSRLKASVSRDFRHLFFLDSNPIGPLINSRKYFRIRFRFRWDIRSQSDLRSVQYTAEIISAVSNIPRKENRIIHFSIVAFKETIRRNSFRGEPIYLERKDLK